MVHASVLAFLQRALGARGFFKNLKNILDKEGREH